MQTVRIHAPDKTGAFEVDMQDELFAALVEQSEREGVPISAVINAALARRLDPERRRPRKEKVQDLFEELTNELGKTAALLRLLGGRTVLPGENGSVLGIQAAGIGQLIEDAVLGMDGRIAAVMEEVLKDA